MEIKTRNYNINDVYKDLDLSLPIHPLTGNIKNSEGIKAVNKSIKNLVMTAKWDVPFNPNLYCGIHEMLFESASPVYFSHMRTKISDLLEKHEPRVEVQEVDIVHTSDQEVTITIIYEITAVELVVTTSIILKRDR